MKKLEEKINKRSKVEQLFILMLMFVFIIGVFCVTGCGGKSCETPSCGSEDFGDGTAYGCSIPGLGGILSSGSGCDSACWPQSCKIVSFSGSENDENTNEEDVTKIAACDVRYYGNGCLGCGQQEKSCYSGYIKLKDSQTDLNGFFYGSTDNEEKIMGCYNGCGGCIGSGGMGKYLIEELEYTTGVK